MLTVNSKDLNSVITSFQNKGVVGGDGGEEGVGEEREKCGLLINGFFVLVGFVYWDKRLWMSFCTGASACGWVFALGQAPLDGFLYWGKCLWMGVCTGASTCEGVCVLGQVPVGEFVY